MVSISNLEQLSMSCKHMTEPPNKGHFGNTSFVLSSEVVPISEVHHILVLFHVILGRNTQLSFMYLRAVHADNTSHPSCCMGLNPLLHRPPGPLQALCSM